jgi:hypothetical protein
MNKQSVRAAWDAIGKSGAWIVLMIITLITEAILGASLWGAMLIAYCGIMYGLTRIAEAIESLGKSKEEG